MERYEKGRELEKKASAVEVWFTGSDEDDTKRIWSALQSGEVTATVRFGDRTEGTADPKLGYQVGSTIELKAQKPDRSFFPHAEQAEVIGTVKKTISELNDHDLEGATLDGTTVAEVLTKLEKAYGKTFSPDETVTIVKFKLTTTK